MRRILPIVSCVFAAALMPAAAPAQGQGDGRAAAKEEAPSIPPPNISVTRQSGTFGGQRINYLATAG